MTPNPVNPARGDTLSRERSSEVSTEVPSLDAAAEPQERVDLDAIRARWEAAHELTFSDLGASIDCLAPAGSPCNTGCAENCGPWQDGYECEHPRTTPLGYCNPMQWIGNDDDGIAELGAGSIRVEPFFDGSHWLWRPALSPTDIADLLAEVQRLRRLVEPMTERLLAALRERPRTTFAAALDEWRRSASPEVPSDLDAALRAWEAAEAEVARLTEGIRAGIAHREEISQEGESR